MVEPWRRGTLLAAERWTIGIADAPADSIVRAGRLPSVRWLAPPSRRRYLADPMTWRDADGTWQIAAEEFDILRNCGRIVTHTLEAGVIAPGPWRVAVAADAHLSYPFVFCYEGEIYLVPESWEAGRAEAWRLTAAPDRWERTGRIVLDGLAPVDPTLVEHAGRWWLFCTDRRGEPDRDLLLFHGPSPFGPWTAHPRNPVLSDARGARPAGPLFPVDGALHRPGQDCSHGYGAGIIVHRIESMTPDDYRERVACTLAPDPTSGWPDGVHTLCPAGAVTLVDGKRAGRPWWALAASLWGATSNFRRRRALAHMPTTAPGP